MKTNVWLLSFCQAIMNTGNVLLIATSSLVGYTLAANKAFATLPLGLQFFATMLTTVPASMLMKRVGRRTGFMVGTLTGLAGALLAAFAILSEAFVLFCVAAALVGAFNGFGTYYRFAAADVATDDYRPTAISYVMAGGVIAAIVGPNLADWTSGLWASARFAGSYAALAALYAVSLVTLVRLDIPRPSEHEARDTGRPLHVIVAQGTFVVAVLGAAFGFGIMSLIMTATPLAMHAHAHPFSEAALVIEWHVLGMFAPSFFTGHLIRRFGVLNIMLTGAVLNLLCVAINLMGTDVAHFWTALLMLGVGWNFLFAGGTTLLTETYETAEKAKIQAFNDFMVFTMVMLASLSAGALHYHFGWRAVNLGVLPPVALVLCALLWLKWRPRARAAADAG